MSGHNRRPAGRTSAYAACRAAFRAMPAQAGADSGADTADRGGATVEAALALCAVVVVLVLALSAVLAVFAQLRCTDAAREVARLVARGEAERAGDVVRQIAPAGARLSLGVVGDEVSVEVTAEPAGGFLPGVRLRAQAYSVLEPQAVDSAGSTATSRPRTGSGDGRPVTGSGDGRPVTGSGESSDRSGDSSEISGRGRAP